MEDIRAEAEEHQLKEDITKILDEKENMVWDYNTGLYTEDKIYEFEPSKRI